MATFEKGDMWSIWGKTNLFVFTANNTIKKDKSLVMGRGMAKQVKDRCPGIDATIGKRLEVRGYANIQMDYGLSVDYWGSMLIGAFQVKYHYKDVAFIHLVRYSTATLFNWIVQNQHKHPISIRIDMNYPGIGNGGLTKAQVKPIISLLPDCVHIWEYQHDPQLTFMDIPNA
jgi:hypothetical protein